MQMRKLSGKLNRTSQRFNEKIGIAKKTELNEDYLGLEKKCQNFSHMLDELVEAVESFVNSKRKKSLPLVTSRCCDDSPLLVDNLNHLREAVTQEAAEASQFHADAMQNVVAPLKAIRDTKLREIFKLHKKISTRRLDYDRKKSGGKTEEAESLREQLDESVGQCCSLMSDLLGTEVVGRSLQNMNEVHDLIRALAEFHKRSLSNLTSILDGYDKSLQSKLEESTFPGPWAMALCNYKGLDSEELSFHRGDRIELRLRMDGNIYYGIVNGRLGLVKGSRIRVVVPINL